MPTKVSHLTGLREQALQSNSRYRMSGLQEQARLDKFYLSLGDNTK